MLDVQYGQASDPGKVRTNNEDALGSFIPSSRHQVRSHGFLFAVADGVGGMDLGEVASATAISVVTEGFEKAQADTMLIALMPRLTAHANAAVHDLRLAPQYRGKNMATTLVACALRHDQAVVSHVGDSRCYLIRGAGAPISLRRHRVSAPGGGGRGGGPPVRGDDGGAAGHRRLSRPATPPSATMDYTTR